MSIMICDSTLQSLDVCKALLRSPILTMKRPDDEEGNMGFISPQKPRHPECIFIFQGKVKISSCSTFSPYKVSGPHVRACALEGIYIYHTTLSGKLLKTTKQLMKQAL